MQLAEVGALLLQRRELLRDVGEPGLERGHGAEQVGLAQTLGRGELLNARRREELTDLRGCRRGGEHQHGGLSAGERASKDLELAGDGGFHAVLQLLDRVARARAEHDVEHVAVGPADLVTQERLERGEELLVPQEQHALVLERRPPSRETLGATTHVTRNASGRGERRRVWRRRPRRRHSRAQEPQRRLRVFDDPPQLARLAIDRLGPLPRRGRDVGADEVHALQILEHVQRPIEQSSRTRDPDACHVDDHDGTPVTRASAAAARRDTSAVASSMA